MKNKKFSKVNQLILPVIALLFQLPAWILFQKYSKGSPIVIFSYTCFEVVCLIIFIRAIISIGKTKKNESLSEEEAAKFSSQEMTAAIENLLNKSESLNAKFNKDKDQIKVLCEQLKNFNTVNDITAIKLEQNIIWKLTEINTACGAVLSGKNEMQLKKQIHELEKLIKSRKAFEK